MKLTPLERRVLEAAHNDVVLELEGIDQHPGSNLRWAKACVRLSEAGLMTSDPTKQCTRHGWKLTEKGHMLLSALKVDEIAKSRGSVQRPHRSMWKGHK